MFDLSAFRLQDMALCSTTVRQLGEGATSIEAVADRITRFLYTNLTAGQDEDPACVLVRAFKTHPYNRLTSELQELVDARLGDKPTNLDMKCLTLLASTGAISGWNNPALSSRFRVIPLAGPEALAQLPMFAQLFAQFHVDVPGIQDTSTSLLLDQRAPAFTTFHVPHAVNSPYVPGQQDFVIPFGVQSVFGCGGLLPTGDMFALVLFAKVPVTKDTADLFRTIALSVKLALAPFEHSQLILPTTAAASGASNTQAPVTLTALQDRVATLEAILTSQEQTIEVQSRRLEDSLAEAVRQGQKLQKQSMRFETLSATSPIGIFETDAEGSCLYTNAAWQTIAGLSLADTLGDGWSRAILKEDRPTVFAGWKQSADADSYFSLEFRMQRPDGTIRWVHTRSRPLTNKAGQVTGHVGTTEDITERKEAEEAATRSHDMLKSFVEHTPAAVAMLDKELRYVAASKRWLQDYRLGEQNIIGRHHYDLFPEIKAMPEWQAIHQRCLAGAVERREEDRFVRADGSDDWLRWEVRPWQDSTGAIGGIIMLTEDITARKRTEDALRQSTTVQEALLTHAGYAVIAVDPSGLITLFNPAAERLLGYTAGEMIGKQTPAVFHDRDEIAARAAEFGADLGITVTPGFDVFAEKARRNLPNQYEWTYIRKDGRRIPVMLSITALRDSTDTILGYIAMALDLTDRKATDAQFQTIMEAMPTGIVLVDEAGRITMVNQHTSQMFGYAPSTLLGQPIEILLPERFRTAHPDQVQAFIKAPAARAMGAGRDLAGRRKDRSEFAVEIGLAPIHTPQGLQILASIADISLRKQTESTRFRLQQAINHAQDGMALFDEAGQFTYMNPAYASIYGHAVDDLLGKSWLQLYPEEWAAMIDQMYLPMLRSEGRWQGEVVGKKKSGDAFHVDLSLTLLEEPGTGRQTILCTCRDISLRKQMEHDLITAKEAAEAGIRAKSEFLATMSHEIRTPMNGVLGMTDLLIDTTLTSEQREFVHTLKHSGESLMRIINDILDFSKIEAGKLTIETLPFDLRTTIEDTLDLLAPTAQTKHLELVGLIDAQAPNTVIGDPGRIRQIMTNLIGNAIKFTESGEVLVQVLKVEETAASVLLRFEIVDTGIGLTEGAKTKLFQSFTQADSSTARKYGGTGLGLTICKRLTELMGGQIGIQSFPGAGTCVWFTIRLRTQADTPSLPAPVIVESLSGLRICLIDDNATNRSLLQYHACDWKMHYESAEDGPSALALIRRAAAEGKPFDLAILDMHMPGMDGLELGRAIRAEANLNGTRLVLLTSLGRRGDAKLAHSAGFSGYLTKPVRKTHLYDCLRLVMGQAPVSHQNSQAAPAETPLITRHQVAEVTAHIRLLVVDDNPVNQKVAVKMLEKLGHRVDVASNGNEALAALTRHHYNLVFMDCQMPELDGFETTRMIRTHEKPGCHLPIVAMTANAMQGDRERCLASGMDDFVSKPIKSQDLKKVLAQWLNLSDDRAAA